MVSLFYFYSMIYVYVLYSAEFDRIYIGMTNNLERRIHEHNTGQNKSTKAYLLWKHIYSEVFENRMEARKREKYLKSFRGRTFIRLHFIPNATQS